MSMKAYEIEVVEGDWFFNATHDTTLLKVLGLQDKDLENRWHIFSLEELETAYKSLKTCKLEDTFNESEKSRIYYLETLSSKINEMKSKGQKELTLWFY